VIYIAAKMPQYCAIWGFVLALVCSRVAGNPGTVGLARGIWAMGGFGVAGMVMGLLLAGVVSGRRREERRGTPAK
jgi:hypothetical protein